MRSRLRAARMILGLAWRADRRRALAGGTLSLAASTLGPLTGLWLKLLADAALAGDESRALAAAAALGVSWMVGIAAANLAEALLDGLLERIGLLMNEHLIELAAGVPAIEHHERAEYIDRIALLREQEEALAQAATMLIGGLEVPTQLALSAVLLASVSPVLLALPLIAVPSFLLGAAGVRMVDDSRDATADPARRAEHLYELATSPASAKELRIFGLESEIVARHREVWERTTRERIRSEARAGALNASGFVLFGLGYVAALTFVVWRAAEGEASVGDVLLALTVAGQVNQQLGRTAWWFSRLLRRLAMLERYLWLIDYHAAARRTIRATARPPARLERGIDLEGVSFRYPGTDATVLADVDLHLPAGSTVAIVGENGAGKTTLVKLLCRFYEPTAGRIAIDGHDLAELDPEQWRERISGAFQDFVRFELLARETVGVGELARIEDESAVVTALERAEGGDIVELLPAGLATPLGTTYADGHELSGGQWQKLALARGMMREAPLLLVLDEPTASLDAHTEHVLFERYAHGAQRVGSASGAITVLVSHRFSTVRMAELILVVSEGRIVERGSHAELIAFGGLYDELFHLQASAYRRA